MNIRAFTVLATSSRVCRYARSSGFGRPSACISARLSAETGSMSESRVIRTVHPCATRSARSRRAMSSVMIFSLSPLCAVPWSSPPWPGSMTMIREPGGVGPNFHGVASGFGARSPGDGALSGADASVPIRPLPLRKAATASTFEARMESPSGSGVTSTRRSPRSVSAMRTKGASLDPDLTDADRIDRRDRRPFVAAGVGERRILHVDVPALIGETVPFVGRVPAHRDADLQVVALRLQRDPGDDRAAGAVTAEASPTGGIPGGVANGASAAALAEGSGSGAAVGGGSATTAAGVGAAVAAGVGAAATGAPPPAVNAIPTSNGEPGASDVVRRPARRIDRDDRRRVLRRPAAGDAHAVDRAARCIPASEDPTPLKASSTCSACRRASRMPAASRRGSRWWSCGRRCERRARRSAAAAPYRGPSATGST